MNRQAIDSGVDPITGSLRSHPLFLPTLTALLLTLLVLSAVLAVGSGSVHVPAGQVVSVIIDHLSGRGADSAAALGPNDYIVWQLRVPRVIEAACVGAGLALSGAVVQVIVANQIADPYVLGLSSGAGVGAVLVLTTFGAGSAFGLVLPLSAFSGALVTGVLVFALAYRPGQVSAGRMVLVGVAVGHLCSGITSFLVLYQGSADAARQVMFWLLGSLSGAQWRYAVATAVVVVVFGAGLIATAGRLNLLALGDEAAAGLGLRPGLARAVYFVVTALLVGSVVSVSGAIGFVGLVVPNLVRLLVGADHRRVLPVCALVGALLLVWADTAARLVLAPTELPIGILTAVVGVPVFLLAVRHGRNPVSM